MVEAKPQSIAHPLPLLVVLVINNITSKHMLRPVIPIHHSTLLLLDLTLEIALGRQVGGSLLVILVAMAHQLGSFSSSIDSSSIIHLIIPLTISICLVHLFTVLERQLKWGNHLLMGFCHHLRWI
jgi:hypothetical protein